VYSVQFTICCFTIIKRNALNVINNRGLQIILKMMNRGSVYVGRLGCKDFVCGRHTFTVTRFLHRIRGRGMRRVRVKIWLVDYPDGDSEDMTYAQLIKGLDYYIRTMNEGRVVAIFKVMKIYTILTYDASEDKYLIGCTEDGTTMSISSDQLRAQMELGRVSTDLTVCASYGSMHV